VVQFTSEEEEEPMSERSQIRKGRSGKQKSWRAIGKIGTKGTDISTTNKIEGREGPISMSSLIK